MYIHIHVHKYMYIHVHYSTFLAIAFKQDKCVIIITRKLPISIYIYNWNIKLTSDNLQSSHVVYKTLQPLLLKVVFLLDSIFHILQFPTTCTHEYNMITFLNTIHLYRL